MRISCHTGAAERMLLVGIPLQLMLKCPAATTAMMEHGSTQSRPLAVAPIPEAPSRLLSEDDRILGAVVKPALLTRSCPDQ